VERKEKSLTHERLLAPGAGLPEPPAYRASGHRFEVSVVFTSPDATAAALKVADALAKGLTARISLIFPQVVPYPLPVDNPPVSSEFCEGRLSKIANESRVETTIFFYLCRDRLATLRAVLKRGSIVVIGGRRKWWPTPEESLAGKIRRWGHEVIFTEVT
jgi:hypothetical protein